MDYEPKPDRADSFGVRRGNGECRQRLSILQDAWRRVQRPSGLRNQPVRSCDLRCWLVRDPTRKLAAKRRRTGYLTMRLCPAAELTCVRLDAARPRQEVLRIEVVAPAASADYPGGLDARTNNGAEREAVRQHRLRLRFTDHPAATCGNRRAHNDIATLGGAANRYEARLGRVRSEREEPQQ